MFEGDTMIKNSNVYKNTLVIRKNEYKHRISISDVSVHDLELFIGTP